MTVERLIYLDPADIRAVIVECGDCHGRISVPVGKSPHGQHFTECPACGKEWLTDYTQATPIRNTFDWLRQMREAVADKRYPFAIRFECNEPPRS